MLLSWALTVLALGAAAWLLPGFWIDSWVPLVVAALATGVLGMLVRPLIVAAVATVGWVAVGLGALFGQAVVLQLALAIVPGAHFESFWTAVVASWVVALFGTILTWLLSAGTDETFATALIRTRPGRVADPHVRGAVFVQLDGVSFPVMEWALHSGTMPTLRRWVDDGTHTLREWTVQLPCTTPASQQAVLHGTSAGIPAFRWYDRELGRVLVANRPADAAIIETRASNGLGLLADDGVSISNIFTGDAAKASMTMSRLEVSRGSRRTRVVFARFLLRPDGLARSLSRTVAEVVRERFQARRQRRLAVHPRVCRSWTFAALRAMSNGLLRDVNTAVVAEEMMRGAKAIYVDYVDYDEIAHHAGSTRLESLAALGGLDQVLAVLEKVADRAPRGYDFVVLSDHGQSLGEPFAAKYGIGLAELCRELTQSQTTGIEDSIEGWGRVESMLEDLSGDDPSAANLPHAMSRRVERKMQVGAEGVTTELVVLGSGNLGLVYVPGPERLRVEDLELRWPRLIPGLVQQPGIGFVCVLAADGPLVIGASGRHHLATGIIDGDDPLLPYGEHAALMLHTATVRPEAPELYVNSSVEPSNLEVAAFEPLVGSHGGLGGWQDRGFLLGGTSMATGPEPIVGGEALHRLLVGYLQSLGHRTQLGGDPAAEPAVTPERSTR